MGGGGERGWLSELYGGVAMCADVGKRRDVLLARRARPRPRVPDPSPEFARGRDPRLLASDAERPPFGAGVGVGGEVVVRAFGGVAEPLLRDARGILGDTGRSTHASPITGGVGVWVSRDTLSPDAGPGSRRYILGTAHACITRPVHFLPT